MITNLCCEIELPMSKWYFSSRNDDIIRSYFMLDNPSSVCYAYCMDDKLVARISDPDSIEDIEDWLIAHQIPTLGFEVIDVSDVTLYYDIIVTIQFECERDLILFNLTWMDK